MSRPGARPDTVRIGPLTYRVVWDGAAVEARAEQQGHSWAAYSDHERATITLNPEHARDVQRHSLVHEVLHCCLRLSGVWPDAYARAVRRTDEIDVEEHTVAGLAGPLLGVLADNPHVLAWLAMDGP